MSKQKSKIDNNPFAADLSVIEDLATAAESAEEQAYIDQLRAELDEAAMAQRMADEAVAEQRRLDTLAKEQAERQHMKASARRAIHAAHGETEDTKTHRVTSEQVMWLRDTEADVTVSRCTSPGGKGFWLGDLTPHSGATRRYMRRQFSEGVQSDIMDGLKLHIGQKVDAPDHREITLRPLERSDTRERTTLNTYKDDAIVPQGFNANSIRVLVLEDNPADETAEPVYLMASVAMHDDQQRLIYNL